MRVSGEKIRTRWVLAIVCATTAFCAAVAQVTLVRDGRPTATIVIPDSTPPATDGRELPPDTARRAAEELRKYIARASGAELPIVAASEAPGEDTLILVGRSALSEQFGLRAPTESEEVLIKTFPRGLAILGEVAPAGTNNSPWPMDRGTLNGVYLFLRNYIGYRFYFQRGRHPELGMVTPDRPTITVGPIDFRSAPAFPYRAIVPFGGTGGWKAATRPGRATGFRGSNMQSEARNTRIEPSAPAHKWYCWSDDGGKTFTEPVPWHFEDREVFYSSSSRSNLLRSIKNGKVYWLGIITDHTAYSNQPRYPFVVAEVNDRGVLTKDSVTTVDTRQEGDSARICISDPAIIQDRETGLIELYMNRSREREGFDYWADCYRYRIDVGEARQCSYTLSGKRN